MKTFVVRLYVPAEPEPRPSGAKLCGIAEEIATGRRASFAGDRELLAFLADAAGDRETDLPERSAS